MSDDSNYAERQTARNAKAARDYEAIVHELSPEVRAVLSDKKGKLRMDDSFIGNASDHDISDLPIAAPIIDIASAIDTSEEELAEKFDLTPGQAEGILEWHKGIVRIEAELGLARRLARIIGVLLRANNLKLEVHALAFATRMAAANGLTSQSAAAKTILGPNGKPLTRASLSKRACWWCGFLDLPPGDNMKKKAAAETYSKERKSNHWRAKPTTEIFNRLKKLKGKDSSE